jgi:hypothetical protein
MRGLFEKSPLHPKNFYQPKSPISAREKEAMPPLPQSPKATSRKRQAFSDEPRAAYLFFAGLSLRTKTVPPSSNAEQTKD